MRKKKQTNMNLKKQTNKHEWTNRERPGKSGLSNSDKWYGWADGFVVVYSITDSASFDEVPTYMQKIKSRNGNAPILLLGNKGIRKN